MIPDGKSLLTGKAHIAGNDINALLTVAIGELVVKFKRIYPLPGSLLVLYVTEALFIYSDLTKVVKQSDDSNAFLGIIKTEALSTR